MPVGLLDPGVDVAASRLNLEMSVERVKMETLTLNALTWSSQIGDLESKGEQLVSLPLNPVCPGSLGTTLKTINEVLHKLQSAQAYGHSATYQIW